MCRRTLGEPEIQLFRLYHDLLQGQLERQIEPLRAQMKSAGTQAATVLNFNLSAWDAVHPGFRSEMITQIKVDAAALTASELMMEPPEEIRLAFASLQGAQEAGKAQLEAKRSALEAASRGREDVGRQIAELRSSIEPLLYSRAVADQLAQLRKAHVLVKEAEFWRDHLPAMTPLLKKITDRAKEANEELVVKDFSARLNAEYIALAEREMASSRVRGSPPKGSGRFGDFVAAGWRK